MGDHAPVDRPASAPGGADRQGRGRGLRPRRPRVRGRPGARRRRGHDLRGAARHRGSPALRDPVLPAAAQHHRPRGEAARGHGRPLRDEQGHRQDVHDPAAPQRARLRRRLRGDRRGRPVFSRHPGRVRRAGLQRERVPHPREPHGRRQVPLRGHARHARPQHRRHRRGQHGDGLPARLASASEPSWSAASTAARRRRLPPASRSFATRRKRASRSTGSGARPRSSRTTRAA